MDEARQQAKAADTPYDLGNPQVLLAWQRNHLANERTFLAWCRTGLALFAFSFVIERFDFFIRQMAASPMFEGIQHKHLHTEFLSLSTFLLGVLVMALSAWRFWYVRKLINTGAKSFSSLPDTIFIIAVSSLIVGLFATFWLLIMT